MERKSVQEKYSYLLDAKIGRWTVMKITKINEMSLRGMDILRRLFL